MPLILRLQPDDPLAVEQAAIALFSYRAPALRRPVERSATSPRDIGDTIITMWGRVGSTGGALAGLQAEAPSHLVKRWQQLTGKQEQLALAA